MTHFAGGIESTAWAERQRAERYRLRAFAMRRLALERRRYWYWVASEADSYQVQFEDARRLLVEVLDRLEGGHLPEMDWFRRVREAV